MSGSDSFFSLGGHSIIAQQTLLAVRQKWKDVDVPMSTIFQHPMLRGFAENINQALDPIGLRLDSADQPEEIPEDEDYLADARDLCKHLPESFSAERLIFSENKTVFLTGATGFLGAFILQDLFTRNSPSVKVVALVRARDPGTALSRVKTCQAYGIWNESRSSCLECVAGDSEKPNFDLSPDMWNRLADEVDLVCHNGALVHWVLPYSRLRSPNVLSTMTILSLCAAKKPKYPGLVSSTSVLDSDHYVNLSEKSVTEGGTGVSEADDLEDS